MKSPLRNNSIKEVNAWIWKCWGVGYNTIIGRFYGIINFVLLASTFLIAKGFDISFIQTILIGIGIGIIVLVIGFVYYTLGFQKAENSINFMEQPELNEIYLRVKRTEEKVDSLTKMLEAK